jgi:PilZ domain
MGSRRQPRVAMTLSVSLCGMDAKGRAFLEHVRTRDISRDGAQLEGVLGTLGIGDAVTLRCEGNTSRFRVIWEQDGEGRARTLGLSRIGSSSLPVDSVLVASAPDDYLRPRVTVRRRHPRFKCEVPVELKLKEKAGPLWVATSDVSEGGCRLQVPQLVDPLSEVAVALWLDDKKIWIEGTVAYSLYGWGAGIRFRGMSEDSQQKLLRLIAERDAAVSDRRSASEYYLTQEQYVGEAVDTSQPERVVSDLERLLEN